MAGYLPPGHRRLNLGGTAMIRVLLWDIDNTLLDFPAAERLALQAAFRDFALGPCPEDRVARYAALNAGYWRQLERGEITKAELLTQRFQVFFQQEGLPCPDPAAFNRTYQDYLGETVVFLDHSDQLLRDLHSQVKQYAVTNGSQRVQEKKLAQPGLFPAGAPGHWPLGEGGDPPHWGLPHQRHGRGQPGRHPLLLVQPPGAACPRGPGHPV